MLPRETQTSTATCALSMPCMLQAKVVSQRSRTIRTESTKPSLPWTIRVAPCRAIPASKAEKGGNGSLIKWRRKPIAGFSLAEEWNNNTALWVQMLRDLCLVVTSRRIWRGAGILLRSRTRLRRMWALVKILIILGLIFLKNQINRRNRINRGNRILNLWRKKKLR